MKKEYDKCEICRSNLKYLENESLAHCIFCKEKKKTSIICPNGHYICDQCHSKDAITAILDFCEQTELVDPFEIADEIMKHPNFKVYGPEHHVLVPAALLTSLKNLNIKKTDGVSVTFADIVKAVDRARKLPGGWCGLYGNCGAGVGSGVAISVFTGATPAKDIPRSLSILTTSRSLEKIADNIEHCCKRSVRISIAQAIKMLNEKFDLDLDFKAKKCIFSDLNDKCERQKCPFF